VAVLGWKSKSPDAAAEKEAESGGAPIPICSFQPPLSSVASRQYRRDARG